MAEKAEYGELVRQLGAVGSERRELGRILPDGCSNGAATALALLGRDGDMRIGRLAELLAVDPSVTSRLVAHLAARGRLDRSPDPADRRWRILRLTADSRVRLAELSDRTAEELARRLSDWSDDDVRRLTLLLARLRAGFDDPRPAQNTCAAPPRAAPSPPGTPAVTRT
ncbi:MarR family winged helix-turn-helix transcriptional regulator [Streptomyces sp. NPDC002172]